MNNNKNSNEIQLANLTHAGQFHAKNAQVLYLSVLCPTHHYFLSASQAANVFRVCPFYQTRRHRAFSVIQHFQNLLLAQLAANFLQIRPDSTFQRLSMAACTVVFKQRFCRRRIVAARWSCCRRCFGSRGFSRGLCLLITATGSKRE